MARKKTNRYFVSDDPIQTDRIKNGLELLGLKVMAEGFESIAEQIVEQHKTPIDFLERILSVELAGQDDSRRNKWEQQAKFPYKKTLKDFNFAFQPTIDEPLIQELASLRFIEQGKNIIFLGPPGVGKTHLSVSLGFISIEQGLDVRLVTISDLADLVDTAGSEAPALRRLTTMFMRPRLLILDEMDDTKMSDDASKFLEKVIRYRCEKDLSIIFTSNNTFDQWGSLFANQTQASKMLDRILERCVIIQINGKTYRNQDVFEN